MPGYLGDKKLMKVHDLSKMKKQCNIFEIKIHNRQYFTPDSLKNAVNQNYNPCKFCN